MYESTQCMVSIIVATYNQVEYLPQCLDSLLDQTMHYEAYEIVVVDDGSTDGTKEIISKYKRHLKVVNHPRRKGLAKACNSGLHQAHGDYIVRVDSDDWLDDKALEQLVRAQELNQGPEIIIPDYWVVTETEVTVVRPDINNIFTWMAGGLLLKREAVLKIGGYREFFWEEYDLYLRMLSKGARVIRLGTPVLYHREHSRSITASRDARAQGWEELINAWPMSTLRRFGFHDELTKY